MTHENTDLLLEMTEATFVLHAKIGKLKMPRKIKNELFDRLSEFSGKLLEVAKFDI